MTPLETQTGNNLYYKPNQSALEDDSTFTHEFIHGFPDKTSMVANRHTCLPALARQARLTS